MRVEKRLWIYASLAAPEGVALVSPVQKSKTIPTCILIVGNHTTQSTSLLPPLSKLASGSGVKLAADLLPHTTSRFWATSGRLEANLRKFSPSHVLFSIDPRDKESKVQIEEITNDAKSEVIWLPPPEVFSLGAIKAPQKATPITLAAWAAQIWKTIT